MKLSHHKKSFLVISTLISLFITPVFAQTGTGTQGGSQGGTQGGTSGGGAGQSDNALLQQIADNTANTLQRVNDIPNMIANLSQFILAWMSPDTSDPTATIQASFTQMGNLLVQNQATQAGLQAQLNADLLTGTTKNTLPNSNDLIYTSLLGSPMYTPDPRGGNVNVQYNYIKNASGIGLSHMLPSGGWRGPGVTRYQNYYNTIMAVESYNAYVLSQQYAEGNQFNALQTTLITQATDPAAWFAQVASENIGWVMRQILMYQSQTFVLMTQLLQTTKQLATAQVMTNAVLIANNDVNEGTMVRSAQGS